MQSLSTTNVNNVATDKGWNSQPHGNLNESWLEVVEFLKSLNFGQYIDRFQSEGFDRMDALFDIDMDDLRDMNVKRGHAKILLTQINLIKASDCINNKQPLPNTMINTQNSSRSSNQVVGCLYLYCAQNTAKFISYTAIII